MIKFISLTKIGIRSLQNRVGSWVERTSSAICKKSINGVRPLQLLFSLTIIRFLKSDQKDFAFQPVGRWYLGHYGDPPNAVGPFDSIGFIFLKGSHSDQQIVAPCTFLWIGSLLLVLENINHDHKCNLQRGSGGRIQTAHKVKGYLAILTWTNTNENLDKYNS